MFDQKRENRMGIAFQQPRTRSTTSFQSTTSNIEKPQPHHQQQPNKPQKTNRTIGRLRGTTGWETCSHKTIQQQPKQKRRLFRLTVRNLFHR
jgi:hypothetical protein